MTRQRECLVETRNVNSHDVTILIRPEDKLAPIMKDGEI